MIVQRRDQVKSNEEWAIVLWLREAVRHYLVDAWEYEPETFELIPAKIYNALVGTYKSGEPKYKDKSLHQSLTYTPDFRIEFTELGLDMMRTYFEKSLFGGIVYIDVKGVMDPYHDAKQFSVVQKVMFDKTGIWVQKVIPYAKVKGKAVGLFAKTFAPHELRHKQNGELNECSKHCKSIEEFLK